MYGDTKHFIAMCENNEDPEKRGRIQVRIIGIHDNFSNSTSVPDFNTGHGLPLKDLPWASCCFPCTYGGTSSSTLPAPQVQKGAFVFGVSLDGDFYSQLIILGVLPTLYNIDALSKNPFESDASNLGLGDSGNSSSPAKNTNLIQGDIPFNDWLEAMGWCESGQQEGRTQARSDGKAGLSKRRGYWSLSRGEAIKVIGHSADYDYVADVELAPTPVIDKNAPGISPIGTDCNLGGGNIACVSCHFGQLRTNRTYDIDGTRQSTARHWHGGVDLNARIEPKGRGCTIRSVLSGIVTEIHGAKACNKVVIKSTVKTTGGQTVDVQLRYLHMAKINVSPNEAVKAGQTIGTAGDVGSPGAVHLHFECRVNVDGHYMIANPEDFLRYCGVTLTEALAPGVNGVIGIPESDVDYYNSITPAVAFTDTTEPDKGASNVPDDVNQANLSKLEKLIKTKFPNVSNDLFEMCHIAVRDEMFVDGADGDLGYLGTEEKYLKQYEYINELLLNKGFSQIIITCLMTDFHKECNGDPIYMTMRYTEGEPKTVKSKFQSLYGQDSVPESVRYKDLCDGLNQVCSKNRMGNYFRKAFGYVYQQCDKNGKSGEGIERAEKGSDGNSYPLGRVTVSSYGVK